MDKERKKEYYTQKEVKEKGFTVRMIESLLPKPILRPNPMYRKAAPMKLWKCEDVDRAMRSDIFRQFIEKNEKRRSEAKKAIETKKAKLHDEIMQKISEIIVNRVDFITLQDRTLCEKRDWYEYQAAIRNRIEDISVENADMPTKLRWMVNYVRHNLTKYDEDLYSISGKVSCHTEYGIYKNAVLDKIADVYPELVEECMRQKL